MKVNLKRFKIEKVVSTRDGRPALKHVYLDVAGSVLVATDSMALAVVPVSELAFDDTEGLLPVEAIVLARKDQPKDELAELVANGRASVRMGGERADFDRPTWDGFPNWRGLFEWTRSKPVVSIRLSPRRLLELAQALGNENAVTLDVYGPSVQMRVTPLYGEAGAKGILMPITSREDGEE